MAANGGIDAAGTDVMVGYGPNFQNFGGGPADPSNPSAKLNTPNGAPLMFLGRQMYLLGVSLEIKSIALTRITPGPIVARIDANSGLTFRFGTGFPYQGRERQRTAASSPAANCRERYSVRSDRDGPDQPFRRERHDEPDLQHADAGQSDD